MLAVIRKNSFVMKQNPCQSMSANFVYLRSAVSPWPQKIHARLGLWTDACAVCTSVYSNCTLSYHFFYLESRAAPSTYPTPIFPLNINHSLKWTIPAIFTLAKMSKGHISVQNCGFLILCQFDAGLFAPGSFAPWLITPPIEYTGDSLLRLVFQFTERQQVSVASRHWLIATSINVTYDKLNMWSQFMKSAIFGFIAVAELLYIAYT